MLHPQAVEVWGVGESERTAGIASLEVARAELEAALSDNAQWQALIADADQASRERREQELAGNPMYRSWRAVNAAIEGLRDKSASTESAFKQESREPSDDLTRIRGVDAETAGALAGLGVTRYAQIAAWRRDDVRAVSRALGLTREVSRQNWIEQAALLELRKGDQRHRGMAREREIGLPDILEAIRRDASAYGGEQAVLAADEHGSAALDEPAIVETEVSPALAQAPAEPQPVAAEPSTEPPPSAPAADQTAMAPPPASQTSRIPTVAASAHVNTDAAQRAKRLEEERRRLRNTAPEAEEATVTFVIRESAELAVGVDATLREGTSIHPAHGKVRRSESRIESYAPIKNLAEEAEVVLVMPGSHHGHPMIDRPVSEGPVRRFLRSLTRG